jgi:hypothetical protein
MYGAKRVYKKIKGWSDVLPKALPAPAYSLSDWKVGKAANDENGFS